MTSSQELIDAVATRVLRPLIAGGALSPVAPIGAKRALELASQPIVAADEELPKLRLRAARALVPVDELPDPGAGEWLCAFALSDLLQITNPTLDGVFDHGRQRALLDMVDTVLAHAGAPGTVGATLARHATFGRLLELERVDTHVSWWVGHHDYRGAEPPARVLAWPRVRRVQRRADHVSLTRMPPDDAAWAERWKAAVAQLLAATPLTALASLSRVEPRFEWTGPTLDVVALPAGRALALRAVERAGELTVASANARAAAGRVTEDAPRRVALAFAAELDALLTARRSA